MSQSISLSASPEDPPATNGRRPGSVRHLPPAERTDEFAAAVDDETDDETEAAPVTKSKGLAKRVAAAQRDVVLQDDPALLERKSTLERFLDQRAARKIRARDRRMRNKSSATSYELDREDQRIALDAKRGERDKRRLTSHDAAVAAEVRRRRLAVRLSTLGATASVLGGSFNVQDAFTRLLSLGSGEALYWIGYALEPMATLPLLAILIMQGGARPDEHSDRHDRGPSWWMDVRKWFLFAIALGLNSGLHAALGEYGAAAMWLWVPVLLVVSTGVLQDSSMLSSQRLLAMQTELELNAPLGPLEGVEAAVLRQSWEMYRWDREGRIGGERDEAGLPSVTQMGKTYREMTGGRISVPTLQQVKRTLAGIHALEALRAGADQPE